MSLPITLVCMADRHDICKGCACACHDERKPSPEEVRTVNKAHAGVYDGKYRCSCGYDTITCKLCHGRQWVPGRDEHNHEEAPFPCPLCRYVVMTEGEPARTLTYEEREASWRALRGHLYGP